MVHIYKGPIQHLHARRASVTQFGEEFGTRASRSVHRSMIGNFFFFFSSGYGKPQFYWPVCIG